MSPESLLGYVIAFMAIVPAILVVAQVRYHVFSGLRPTGVLLAVLVLFYYVQVVPFVYEYFAAGSPYAGRYLAAIALMFACVVAGIALADVVYRPPSPSVAYRPYGDSPDALGNPLLFWAAAGACSFLVLYHVVFGHGLEAMGQFAAGEGEAQALQNLRWQVNFGDPGPAAYAAALARSALLPPLALAMVSLALFRRGVWPKVAALGLWFVVALGRAATLHKAPLAFWLVAPVLVFATRRGIRRRLTVLLPAVGAFIGVISLMYAFVYGGSASTGFEQSLTRVTFVPQRCLAAYLMTFPDYHPHLGGASISFVHTLSSDSPHVPSWVYVAEFEHIPRSTPNAVFIADGWADFGWVGIVVVAVLVGLLIRLGESVLRRAPAIPLFHGAYVAFMISTVYLSSAALPTALLTWGVALGPFGVLLIWSLRSLRGTRAAEKELAQPAGAWPGGR